MIVDRCQFDAQDRKTCSMALTDLIDSRYVPLGRVHTGQAVSCPTHDVYQKLASHLQRMNDSMAQHLEPLFQELSEMQVDKLALFQVNSCVLSVFAFLLCFFVVESSPHQFELHQHIEYLLNYFVGKDAVQAFVERCVI